MKMTMDEIREELLEILAEEEEQWDDERIAKVLAHAEEIDAYLTEEDDWDEEIFMQMLLETDEEIRDEMFSGGRRVQK